MWYHDRSIKLTFPDSWDVVTYWPDTPPPLTDKQIAERINSPIGQPPLRGLAEGKSKPVIVVDDLARPTPVFRILPFLLAELQAAGIRSDDVRILIATGTHGEQDKRGLTSKIGKETFESCKVIVHNDRKRTKFIGKTSFGSSVHVNSEVLNSDLLIGVGGVYPQHTTGFGGGSKLALGVLGRKSVIHLHYRHAGMGGTYDIDNDFRRDVTEMARMIGLSTIYTVHVDARQEIVNLMCGDHFTYYPQAADFSRQRYTAPLPDGADMVIANAYPFDNSYFFLRKSMKPVRCASREATKVMIASNHEGIGEHGLFQQGKNPRLDRYRALYYKASTMEAEVIVSKIIKALFARIQRPANTVTESSAPPEKLENLWLYVPKGGFMSIPPSDEIKISGAWDEILEAVEQQHPSKSSIKVRIYPCASLQCLDARTTQVGDFAD